jgi:hypothetical protein
MTEKNIVFNDYSNFKLENLNAYRSCDENKTDCFHYMFVNGRDIHKELDLYNNIPEQIERNKLEHLFSTNNDLKEYILNDSVIDELIVSTNSDETTVINSILTHIRPYLFSRKQITSEDITTLKENVIQSIRFSKYFMTDLDSQLKFLMSSETISNIKAKVHSNLNDYSIDVKDDYITSILRTEINHYRSRYRDSNPKIKDDNVNSVYTNGMSLLKERDIFNILSDTIARITSSITIEQNVIKNNSKLDRWDTVLGDNNKQGLRQFTNIKLNNRKPPGMMFNMTY